jgi:hypothetical protein
VLFAVITGITSLYAVWEENGVLITGVPGDEYDLAITETIGDGGIIVAWRDERTGEGLYDIYAARLDPDGNLPWTAGGVPVCTATGMQRYQMVVPDGAGGAIIAWLDQRAPAMAIFAQRLDPDGNPLWTVNGDSLFTEINNLESLMMISDGAGGAIVLWADARFGTYDIIGQRIDENGARLWATTGQPITNLTGYQIPEALIAAGGGEFIIAYRDNRAGNYDLYAQKFDLTGAVDWGSTGAAVCSDPSAQGNISMVADGAGGAVFVWSDYRTGDEEVFAQKVDQWGNGDWATDGVPIADGFPVLGSPTITTDTEGGAIIGFVTGISGPGFDFHVKVQRIDLDGDIQWWPGGIMVSTGSWATYSECICPDGEGGALVLMYDFRVDPSTIGLYMQRIDHDGMPRWTPGGRPVNSGLEGGETDITYMTSDLQGGAYCVWSDDRNADFDLFGSRINMYGGIGPLNEPPAISSVSDIPNDQGGRLMLRWMASEADTFPEAWIDSYSAWRLLPDQMAAGGRTMPLADAGPVEDLSVGAVRYIETAAGEAWELVGYIPARQAGEYALMVESLYDSMGTDPGWQYFVVTAHMDNSILYFDSPVDSGYSVDNLSPALPVAFGGIQSLAPPGLSLYWDAGTEPDLALYEVYKGAAEDFIPGGLNFVGSIYDTEFLDESWTPADQDFFKLIAVDVHGNRGPASTLRPENIYVGTLLQSWSAVWNESWIELRWTLSQIDDGIGFHVLRSGKSGGEFEEIEGPHLDRDGMTFVLEDHTCEPGVTYLYRIEVEESGGRRVLFETEEISAPALPLTLHQNVPNPFNPSTSIAFYLPERSRVRIDVYDVAGRLVTTLMDGTRPGGNHTVEWNGSDASGRTAASGVYFYRLVAGRFEQTKKMILLR